MITGFKPTWRYTKDELPNEDEEVFCDTGEFFGYQTLTYDGDAFYDNECRYFEVTRWVRVSEIVAMLNSNA